MFWNYTETWIILANVPKSNEEWAAMEIHSFACVDINVFLVLDYVLSLQFRTSTEVLLQGIVARLWSSQWLMLIQFLSRVIDF